MLLLTAMMSGRLCAQTLYNNDTTYFCTTSWRGGVILHNYQNMGGTSEAFDSWAIITGVDSTFTIHLTFTNTNGASLVPINGYFDVWDGDPENGTLLIHHTGLQFNNQNFPVTGNQITLHLHFNAHSTDTSALIYSQLFQMSWNSSNYSYSLPNPCGVDFSASIDSITATGAILHYQPAGIPVLVTVDGQNYYSSGGTFYIYGLAPNTYYRVSAIPNLPITAPCCLQTMEFYTNPLSHLGCPDPLDLHSDYVRCIHNGKIGVMDAGNDSPFSQHTIHTNPNETDETTDNYLHTVGPGLPGSVRLGNWLSGSGSESITYYLHVDTTLYSLILLHYAAVLQDPGHSPAQQPRFTMRILDENDSVIDPTCGAANFIADSSLGWALHGSALCKDWTTVAISLNAYHGQNVRLQFYTKDCSRGEHFGYAYFYVECQQPSITSEHCGTVDTNTLTAPDGFNYLWYYDSPSNPVATTQSYTYSTSLGTINCRLSFIENPSCYVTLSTYVSNFWPQAAIDTLYTLDNGCDGYVVQFLNRSTILGDDSLPQHGNPPCETALWVFGDGYVSAEQSPLHTYHHPGTYPVRLISGLAGGRCTDTAFYVLVTPDAWAPARQYHTCCDSLLWLDSNWYSHDTVGPTVRIPFPETCDTIYTLHLNILPTSHHYQPPDTICYNSGYYWRGQTVPVSLSLSDTIFHLFSDTLVGANGCDSIEYLQLVQLPTDPLDIEVQPDCGLGLYLLTAATENPFWRWSSSPHDPSLDGHEGDRQLWVCPESTTTYSLTSYHGDSLFCPTTTAKKLAPPTPPRAELEVNPTVLTYDKHTIYAYDHSNKFNKRRWTIVNHHGAAHDTVPLLDTLQRITYPVAIDDYDSVTIILEVSNAFCCDTASQTLPIVRSAVFAPNVFIPDADRNNRFTIVCNGALEAELTIYNRQGLFVFSTTDLAQGWDGTHDGSPCPQGAYVWHLHLRTVDRPDDWTTQIGTVTLLR